MLKQFAKVKVSKNGATLPYTSSSPVPIIFKGIASNWPAIKEGKRAWKDFASLKNRLITHHGPDDSSIIVPIEFNGNYMDDGFQRHSVGFYSILDVLMAEQQGQGETSKWFLAQHELKAVSPVMQEDVHVPLVVGLMKKLMISTRGDDARKTEETKDRKGDDPKKFISSIHSDTEPAIYWNNIWLGGFRGTASPCHHDPFQNIFIQIFGTKTIKLFSPDDSAFMYPAKDSVQKNTSTITDFTRQDGGGNVTNAEQQYPLYEKAKGYEVTLRPGDALFIPRKWWHECRTTSTSCSVNWWWL